MKSFIKIHPDDQVAVALTALSSGHLIEIDSQRILLLEDIPQGHKFALCDIQKGNNIIKYGSPIGIATSLISSGSWVHTHNMKTGLSDILDYTYEPDAVRKDNSESNIVVDMKNDDLTVAFSGSHFQGYRRPNGKAAVRNEIWIIPTVGCVNNIATALERKSQCLVKDSIDAVAAFPHPYGCSQMGEDQENTLQILADLINHPNAAGVLVLGLGCENCNIDKLKEYIGDYEEDRVKFLICQESENEITDGLVLLEELASSAAFLKRELIPVSELIIGLKCGGSDGLSGITANPTVGVFSDLLIARGGTTILTEVPEMFGAETLLMNRCETETVFQDTVSLINDFKQYFMNHNQTIYENPSPGNKAGGISTLEDKSLGCTQKSGSSPVKGVLSYGEPIKGSGLHLLSAPGNDLVASTALAASGAHIVLFTTGRGTPFACPVPTMKISTNTDLYQHKKNWIDFDCGTLTEKGTIHELGQELFDFVLEVASGRYVKSEEAGFHDMAIFKQGVTL